MSLLEGAGKTVGESAGKVLGSPFHSIGKIAKNGNIAEIGHMIEKTTIDTGQSIENLTTGFISLGSGLIQQDQELIDRGKGKIQVQISKTYLHTKQGIKNLAMLGGNIGQGILRNDKESVKFGATKLLKSTVAGVFAVGIFELFDVSEVHSNKDGITEDLDIEDSQQLNNKVDGLNYLFGIEHIDTINDNLEGLEHPETGVHYDSTLITLPDGEVIEGVFPDFPYVYEGELPQDMYLESDQKQFNYMNEQLLQAIEVNPEIILDQLTEIQLSQILRGETPEGYVWHHTEIPGKMELVDERLHAMSGHDGGRSIWGGGSVYR